MTTYAFAINLHRCIGCRTCTISCKMENNLASGIQRIKVYNPEDEITYYDRPEGTYPNLTMTWMPVPCQHCDNPPCVEVCPTGASSKLDNGIVYVDQQTCIGCMACMAACPYDARQLDKEANVIEKCSLCAHRLTNDLATTLCQISCPGRAITVGDIEDETSEIAQILTNNETMRLQEEAGTGPNVYYWNSMK